jgi:hypothetical protein
LVKEAVDVLTIIAVPTDISPPEEGEGQNVREMLEEEKKDDGAMEGEEVAVEDKGIIDKVLKACIC